MSRIKSPESGNFSHSNVRETIQLGSALTCGGGNIRHAYL